MEFEEGRQAETPHPSLSPPCACVVRLSSSEEEEEEEEQQEGAGGTDTPAVSTLTDTHTDNRQTRGHSGHIYVCMPVCVRLLHLALRRPCWTRRAWRVWGGCDPSAPHLSPLASKHPNRSISGKSKHVGRPQTLTTTCDAVWLAVCVCLILRGIASMGGYASSSIASIGPKPYQILREAKAPAQVGQQAPTHRAHLHPSQSFPCCAARRPLPIHRTLRDAHWTPRTGTTTQGGETLRITAQTRPLLSVCNSLAGRSLRAAHRRRPLGAL